MKKTLMAFTIVGAVMINSLHAENERSQIVTQIASQNTNARKHAESEALALGPDIVPVLRGVQSAEAEVIVASYDTLLASSDKKASMAAIEFFARQGASRFLSQSLKDIRNADVKLAAVRRIREMGSTQVAGDLATLVDTLAAEDVYRSGSEAATLHALYMEELTGLIASILGENVPANQPLEKKVQTVLGKAKAIKAQAVTDEEK
jgi:hypothetical protein